MTLLEILVIMGTMTGLILSIAITWSLGSSIWIMIASVICGMFLVQMLGVILGNLYTIEDEFEKDD